MKKQPPEAQSNHESDKQIICKKCQASNVEKSASKFCDQCGYRLRRKHKFKEQLEQQYHEHHRTKNQSLASILITNTSDGGWFWGGNELPHLSSRGDRAEDEQKQDPKSPRKYPLVKAQTASGGHTNSLEDERQLRRVSSFGQTPCLPALPLSSSRHKFSGAIVIPTPSPNEFAVTAAVESASRNPCGLLWGEVLAEAIAEFESKRIILAVEIDSDESCMCVLAQKMQIEEAARSRYVVASGISQLRFKYNELEKKVRMNKEKLIMVQHRLAVLHAQHDREQNGEGRVKPEHRETSQEEGDVVQHSSQDNQHEIRESPITEEPAPKRKKTKKKKKKKEESFHARPKINQNDEREAAATLIQRRFRVLRARRLFGEMVKRAYQRVFDPDSKRYFYYNERTRQSQWEPPRALARANAAIAQQHGRRVPSARSLEAAASRVQALYRRRAARHAMRQLLLQVYEKVYDAGSGTYYYYCSKTKTSTWDKPKLLYDDGIPTRASEPTTTDAALLQHTAEDAAATKIQTLFRNRATRQFIRDLAKGNIEKHFDPDAQAWYYFNNRTQQSFWEQARHASLSAAMPANPR